MDKPKPCPWCGWSGDRIDVLRGETFRWMQPECPDCGATPGETRVVERLPNGTPLSDSPANYAAALEMWNTRASPWQPIETAPKDGTTVLLGASGRVTVGEWRAERWPTASEYHGTTGEYLGQHETGECIPAGWYSWDGGFSDDAPPTRWQPLPEPPKD